MTARDGSAQDAAACAAIYEPYVTRTAITFETEPPDAAQMAERIAVALDSHAWVVLEQDGRVTLPNDASAGLHRAMGFQPVGIYRDIGYKLGRWHDVFWSQRPLAAVDDPPAEPG